MHNDELGQLYRTHAGQLLGSLMRTFHDLDLCEELVHDAMVVAIERWPVDGTPDEPTAWLLTVARRRGLDRVRRSAVGATKTEQATARSSGIAGQRRSGRHRDRRRGRRRRRRRARRPTATGVPVLPSGAGSRVAGGADAAGGRRTRDRRDRPRLPARRGDDGPAARAREAQDHARRHPVRDARPGARR